MKLYQALFPNHSTVRLEIKYRKQSNKQTVKQTNTWRLNNMLLYNQKITEEIRVEIKINT